MLIERRLNRTLFYNSGPAEKAGPLSEIYEPVVGFVCGDRSNGTTTLKLMLRPILKIPGVLTPGPGFALSKYFNLLMLL